MNLIMSKKKCHNKSKYLSVIFCTNILTNIFTEVILTIYKCKENDKQLETMICTAGCGDVRDYFYLNRFSL